MRIFAFLSVFALALTTVATAGAQPNDDEPLVHARIQIDSKLFALGEPIPFSLWVSNTGPEPIELVFPDSRVADYQIDNEYRWSNGRGFLQVITTIPLEPGDTELLMEFEHTPDEWFLGPGPHTITGIVPGYAEVDIMVEVHGDSIPPESPFLLEGEVVPPVSALGEPVEFRLSVTNVSDRMASFGVDGCPVVYTLDNRFMPSWACPEFFRLIELEPGETIIFDADEDERLRHLPNVYPLAPGRHQVELRIFDIGAVRVPFGVGPPREELTYFSGRVFGPDGAPVNTGVATLVRLGTASDPDIPGETHEARISEQGFWFIGGIGPGVFLLSVQVNGVRTYYPGTPDPDQAERIVGERGGYRSELDIFVGGPPPPQPLVIRGSVFENSETGFAIPVPGAFVRAVPFEAVRNDSGPPTGDDGTLFPGLPFHIARTGQDGTYEIPVPPGAYRLVAGGLPEFRYEYWQHASTWSDAEVFTISRFGPEVFRILAIGATDIGVSQITGRVLGFHPFHDGPPEPIPGSRVTAFPILTDFAADGMGIPERVYTAEVDDDGFYKMEVPSSTPYYVVATAPQYVAQYYPRAPGMAAASGVDVRPGAATEGIDFILQPQPDPGTWGSIEGFVFESPPNVDCTDLVDCVFPSAGAIVRITPAFPTFAPMEFIARTDANGYYRVDELIADPDGSLSYYIQAEKDGYEPGYYPGGVPFPEAEPLPVFPDQTSDAGRIVLRFVGQQEFVVRGLIVNPEGAPVPGAAVRGYPFPEDPFGHVFEARTDGDGRFVLFAPQGSRLLLSFEAHGFIPEYYEDRYFWQQAQRVSPWPAEARIAPLQIALEGQPAAGPFIQAGRVWASDETGVPHGFGVETTAELTPRLRALSYHRQNISHAFFYVVSALSLAPFEFPLAGDRTGDNGAVILTDLGEGVYFAYADKPGYDPAFFTDEGGFRIPLVLNGATPALLAQVFLQPLLPGVPGTDDRKTMVNEVLNEPNPFRPQTTIHYELSEPAPVTVQVFDYQGGLVRTLVSSEFQLSGSQSVPWDATDATGRRVGAGVYFYRVVAGDRATVSKKMVLLP